MTRTLALALPDNNRVEHFKSTLICYQFLGLLLETDKMFQVLDINK